MKAFVYGLYTGSLGGALISFASSFRGVEIYAAVAVLALVAICLTGLLGCYIVDHPAVARRTH